MTRLFTSLLLILFIVVIAYFFGIAGTVQYFTKSTLEEISQGQIGGVAKILDQQIEGLNKEQRDHKLEEIQSSFKTNVDLLLIDKIPSEKLTTEEINRLKSKGIAVIEKGRGELHYFVSIVDHHAWAIEIKPTMQEQEANFIRGPMLLIEQQLASLPENEWSNEIQQINKSFTAPIRLISLTDAKQNTLIDEKQFQRLSSGESVLVYEQDFFLTDIFYRLSQSDQIIKMGPFEYPYLYRNIQWIALTVLGILIALAIWLWLRPLWRDLRQLNSASLKFGEGQLDTRVKRPRYSLINSSLSSFNNMADHIEQLISSHKMLTNAVSHELRTPVSRLRFGLEMLEKSDNESNKARYIKSMNTDIEELDGMLAELLSYARMNRHGIKLEKSPLLLKDWLYQQTLRLNCEKDEITLTESHKGLSGTAVNCMDHKLMERALHNLVQNACRYAKHNVLIDFQLKNGKYSLSVEDDGVGIPKEFHETIFDPFTRVDDSRDRDSGGYGLGLAIVKQIMNAHSGSVTLQESSLGGVKFLLEWESKS